MITKIDVGPVQLAQAVYVANNCARPLRSLPLRLVEDPFFVHNGFDVKHKQDGSGQTFTVEFISVEEFLGTELDRRVIGYRDLVEMLQQTHDQLTLEQAIRLYRACENRFPNALVLLPISDPIMVPGYAEKMFLARGVEQGRKCWTNSGCFRHSKSSLVLVSPECSFGGETYVVGVVKD